MPLNVREKNRCILIKYREIKPTRPGTVDPAVPNTGRASEGLPLCMKNPFQQDIKLGTFASKSCDTACQENGVTKVVIRDSFSRDSSPSEPGLWGCRMLCVSPVLCAFWVYIMRMFVIQDLDLVPHVNLIMAYIHLYATHGRKANGLGNSEGWMLL